MGKNPAFFYGNNQNEENIMAKKGDCGRTPRVGSKGDAKPTGGKGRRRK